MYLDIRAIRLTVISVTVISTGTAIMNRNTYLQAVLRRVLYKIKIGDPVLYNQKRRVSLVMILSIPHHRLLHPLKRIISR